MPRKRRDTKRAELLARTAQISSCRFTQRIRAVHNRGEEPYVECGPWLELLGKLEEPVKGVTDVRISLYPLEPVVVGPVRPAAIGAVISLKLEMSVVISWSEREFDRLWSMALAGHSKFAYLAFTPPRNGRARIVSASFGSEREEEARELRIAARHTIL